jgi:hypothetical protein
MKKTCVAVVCALIVVSGVGLRASAQEREDTVVVKLPYDFVVDGLVLTKGAYRVSRIDPARGAPELEISSIDTNTSVLVMPTLFDDAKTGRSQITFEYLGGKYFLSAITTPIGTYAIPLPPLAITLAQANDHSTVTSSGTN